jgi:hypothetical protein
MEFQNFLELIIVFIAFYDSTLRNDVKMTIKWLLKKLKHRKNK